MRRVFKFGLAALINLGITIAAPAEATTSKHELASAIVEEAIEQQGGRELLSQIHTIEYTTEGYRNVLEQSETSEGPYLIELQEQLLAFDHRHGGTRMEVSKKVPGLPSFAMMQVSDADFGFMQFGQVRRTIRMEDVAAAREARLLSPERLLLTAAAAPDLKMDDDVTIGGLEHSVISFTLDGSSVSIFLNKFSKLPAGFEYDGALAKSGYWKVYPHVTLRTTFGNWTLVPHGLRLPTLWTMIRNGSLDEVRMAEDISINSRDEDDFSIPQDLRSRALQAEAGKPPAFETIPIDENLVLLAGRWNVLLLKEEEGVTVIEAPISDDYSRTVMEQSKRLFPNSPITSVISTSNSWPHLAGLGAYFDAGIPIYALDTNLQAVCQMLGKDRLSNNIKVEIGVMLVRDRTSVGFGAERFEILPVRGELSERQMMVWFPSRSLLYASDIAQPISEGRFNSPQSVSEILDAVERDGISPEKLVMMHLNTSDWNVLTDFMTRTDLGEFPTSR